MKEIKIKIPDKCGTECPCFREAVTKDANGVSLCLAFDRILAAGYTGAYRCEECEEALMTAAEGENE